MRQQSGIFLLLSLFVFACGPRPYTRSDREHLLYRENGYASYYGNRFQGKRTASGERYDKSLLTAAHASLPFGTLVKVTNQNNGRSVVVRINDRGPFDGDRIIDVSRAAAKQLGILRVGVAPVRLEIVSFP
jgi:rare lipoprotein A